MKGIDISEGGLSLGIDIGGTFTDLVVHDPARGRHVIDKEPTTPEDPTEGVLRGLERLLAREDLQAAAISRTVHATTLFTNALIERKGARTGLITTEGFRDVLEIGRERKYELYDVHIEMPQPLVPRDLRKEVTERLDHLGNVEIPLDEAGVIRAADDLVGEGVQALAITFLHAHANPVHEERALRLIAERHPRLFLTASFEVAPEIREYERTSTAVANAYVMPLAERYLWRLEERLRALGTKGPFFLMLSNGGLTHVDEAKRVPIRLLESGPAAGALAAAFFGTTSGEPHLLAFDMGGTTAKASLIDDGEPFVTYAFEAARTRRFREGSGLPLRISSIELLEIGAGGGSIARLDDLGLLKVGPDSAGAVPGPVCYGRGGSEPTVTDADLLLGYLDPGFFLGGTMPIDRAGAEAALEPVARAGGLDPIELAFGVHDVVNENMAAAARVHIAERGRDPRRYALLATGGAGPVHAYAVAQKLGLGRIVCPPGAGVGSTIGLLMAPARIDRVTTLVARLDEMDWTALESLYQGLADDALAVVGETGADLAAAEVRRLADMRYLGQGFEIVVPLPRGPYKADARNAFERAFETTYERLFARTPPGVPIQTVNLRVEVKAPAPGADVAPGGDQQAAAPGAALKTTRPAYFKDAGGFVDTRVYDRYRLAPGETFAGPAVIEERESTLVVGPDGHFRLEPDGNVVVTLPAAKRS